LPDAGWPWQRDFPALSAEGRAAKLVTACGEMAWHMITIACRRTGNQLPMACGTLALLAGEQAAAGQTYASDAHPLAKAR